MRILFDGPVPVHYAQIYVTSREQPTMEEAFAGQVNGLCGAGEPGELFLITGTHTGRVRLRIESHDAEPPAAAPQWQEVVEAPFQPRAATVDLVPWGDGPLARLPLSPDHPAYRVRYCATGLDQPPERYLLCFWPDRDDPAGDAILRQTTPAAAYWHNWAAALPPPPTLWERVEAEIGKQAERERRNAEHRRQQEIRVWGGRAPSERLRRVRGNVQGIARLDRDLVDGIAEAGDATQRRIAIWAARQAFTLAGLADLDWLAPAWAALDRGEPLPAEFTDTMGLLERILGGRVVTRASISANWVSRGPADPLRAARLDDPVEPVAMALPALPAAALPDPLQAALEALWAGATTYAAQRAVFLAEVRRVFDLDC